MRPASPTEDCLQRYGPSAQLAIHNFNILLKDAFNAFLEGRKETLGIILENKPAGATVDIEVSACQGLGSNLKTLLYFACEKGNNELVALLLNAGARTDVLDEPLGRSLVFNGDYGIAETIVKAMEERKDPNVGDWRCHSLRAKAPFGFDTT